MALVSLCLTQACGLKNETMQAQVSECHDVTTPEDEWPLQACSWKDLLTRTLWCGGALQKALAASLAA